MWKLPDFSVTQILSEIICEESRSPKDFQFAIFVAQNFVNLVHFTIQKVQKCINEPEKENKSYKY